MRGRVYKRGSTWSFVVDVPSDDGQRHQKTKGGFATRKAAEAELRALLSRLDSGGDPFPDDVTVGAYLDQWLAHHRAQVRPSTHKRSTQLVVELKGLLGALRLDRVRPAHIQAALDAMAGRGLAPRTVLRARQVLGQAMRAAVEWQLLPANPVAAVPPPRCERPELVVPTAAELLAIIAAAEGTPYELPVLLACTTGARRGEVLAFRWSDLDVTTGRLRVTGSLQEVPGGLERMAPKTDRARRLVTVPGFVVERLRRHRSEQAERRLLLGAGWAAGDLICDYGGRPMRPDGFSRAFKATAVKAGLPAAVRLHDARHAVATAWLEQGLHPAIASNALGHTSPAFTMSQYQHVVDGMGDKAAAALEAAFAQGGER